MTPKSSTNTIGGEHGLVAVFAALDAYTCRLSVSREEWGEGCQAELGRAKRVWAARVGGSGNGEERKGIAGDEPVGDARGIACQTLPPLPRSHSPTSRLEASQLFADGWNVGADEERKVGESRFEESREGEEMGRSGVGRHIRRLSAD